jgi:hypothetical protein
MLRNEHYNVVPVQVRMGIDKSVNCTEIIRYPSVAILKGDERYGANREYEGETKLHECRNDLSVIDLNSSGWFNEKHEPDSLSM